MHDKEVCVEGFPPILEHVQQMSCACCLLHMYGQAGGIVHIQMFHYKGFIVFCPT